MVPGAGVEPAQCFHRGILSPLRLPISPSGHRCPALRQSSDDHYNKYNGGGTRSRTEVDGFAIHCIATLLFRQYILERETRIELATPTLARLYSTAELFPLLKEALNN